MHFSSRVYKFCKRVADVAMAELASDAPPAAEHVAAAGQPEKKRPQNRLVEEDAVPIDMTKQWARIKKRSGYCGLCADVLRDWVSHCSRRPQCKAHPDSYHPLKSEELAVLEKEFLEECVDPVGAKERKVEAAKQRQAKGWKGPQTTGTADKVYRMDFGKHSGKTVKEIWEEDPGYLRNMMSWKNNILDSRPDLKKAMEEEGILAELCEQRPSLQKERAIRVMVRADLETGKDVHPEVKKLRLLQQIEASEVLQGGARKMP